MALSKARLQLDPVDGKLLEVDDLDRKSVV